MKKKLPSTTIPKRRLYKFNTTANGKLYQQVFMNSAQANLISTVPEGKIIIVNKAACKLLGYSRKELLTKNRTDIFNINERSFQKMLQERNVKRRATAVVTVLKKQNSPFPGEITSAIFTDEKGVEKAITTIADISQSILKQKEIDKIFSIAAKLSYEGLWDWDIVTDEFFPGEGFEELFGHSSKNIAGSFSNWSQHLHPDDRDAVVKGLQHTLASQELSWEHTYRFVKANGSIANVFGRASILRNAEGKACRMIGVIHDISKQKVLEEKLEQEIKLKEKYVAEAAEEAKESERSEIGKELHDNVNQLLGVSRMYLEMAQQGGEKSQLYMGRSSEYSLTAINEIRKLTKRLTTGIIKDLGLCEAIENVTQDTMEINPVKISCNLKGFAEQSVNDKFKLNVFRIVQEQLNNILKHADATKIAITLAQNEKVIMLTISDNGIGFDVRKKREGIGIENIMSRTASYNGRTNLISQPGQGCVLTAMFPVTSALLRHG